MSSRLHPPTPSGPGPPLNPPGRVSACSCLASVGCTTTQLRHCYATERSSPPLRRSASPAASTILGLPVSAIEWCLDRRSGPPRRTRRQSRTTTSLCRPSPASSVRTPPLARAGCAASTAAMSEWLRRKLWTSFEIEKALRGLGYDMPGDLLYSEHHLSHAAAAFYPSPFERAAILTIDGVGEWATSSIGRGQRPHGRAARGAALPALARAALLGVHLLLRLQGELRRVQAHGPRSLRRAPLRRADPRPPDRPATPDGSFRLDLAYFDFLAGLADDQRAASTPLFGGPAAQPESADHPARMRPRRSIQVGRSRRSCCAWPGTHVRLTGRAQDLCLAGGVALNCVANGRLAARGPVRRHLDPAGGGRRRRCARRRAVGLAPGARAAERDVDRARRDARARYSARRSRRGDRGACSTRRGRPYVRIDDDRGRRASAVAELLAEGNVVGWFQGRMEFGPRALGAPVDPRPTRGHPTMQRVLNLKIKRRESFRPFAPAVLAEHADEWFDLDRDSPYMLFVAPVRRSRPSSRRRRPSGPTCSSVLNVRPLVDPGGHPRRRLGAGPDRGRRPRTRASTALLSAFDDAHRLPGPGQHVVQRPRRADRLHARATPTAAS